MSKKHTRKASTLAQLRAEANIPPYPFVVDDKRTIKVPEPTPRQIDAAQKMQREGPDDENVEMMRQQFHLVCGVKAGDEIYEVIADDPVSVMKATLAEIGEWFGADLGEAQTSPS